MKPLKLLLIVSLLTSFFSCEKKVGRPTIFYPIHATIMNSLTGDGVFYYRSYTASYKHDSLYIIGNDTTGSGGGCTGGTQAISLLTIMKNTGTYVCYGTNSCWGYCSMNSFWYSSDSAHYGKVTITKFDTVAHLVSGTFYFGAEMQMPMRNGGADTVTNGVFTNLQY